MVQDTDHVVVLIDPYTRCIAEYAVRVGLQGIDQSAHMA